MVDTTMRHAFADFLESLAEGTFTWDDWSRYIVNHYRDDTLEEYRLNCARLAHRSGPPFPRTEEHRAQLHSWANELRASAAVEKFNEQ